MDGREGREKFGTRKSKMNEHASTTNKQKLKNKSFMMMKHKLKGKAKKSFVEKQKDMRKSMMRSKKFKWFSFLIILGSTICPIRFLQ